MFETREIERHLLKIITTNKILAKPYLHNLNEELFSGIRQNIVRILLSIFDISSTVITDALFEAELHKLFPDKSQESQINRHLTEWKLIQKSIAEEDIEVLFEKLNEKQQSENVAKICEKTLANLQKGDIQSAVEILCSESITLARSGTLEKPTIDLLDYHDILERIEDQKIHPDKYRGLRTGLPTYDKRLGGLFPAEMTLFSAITGVGKSTMLKQIAKGIILNNFKKNVLHVTNEEHREQVRMKYFSLFSEIDYFHFKQATIDSNEITKFTNSMDSINNDRFGRIIIKEIAQFSNVTEIYHEIYKLEQKGFPIHAVIIDYLDHLSPIQKAWSENDEQAKIAWDCKGLCIELNIPVITATQAATIVEAKQEKGRHMGKLDVYGSKRRVHAANVFMGITCGDNFDETQLVANGGDRETYKECDKFWTVDCLKARDGSAFTFRCRHKVISGQVIEEDWENSFENTLIKSVIEEESKKGNQEVEPIVENKISEKKESENRVNPDSVEIQIEENQTKISPDEKTPEIPLEPLQNSSPVSDTKKEFETDTGQQKAKHGQDENKETIEKPVISKKTMDLFKKYKN